MESTNVRRLITKLVMVIVLAVCLFLVVKDGRPSKAALLQDALPPLINKTKSTSVNDVSLVNGTIQVKLRNDSGQPITAAKVALVGKKTTSYISYEWLVGDIDDDNWKPGSLWTFNIPGSAPPYTEDKKLVIQAVVFADNTSEGDKKTLSEIMDDRLGCKLQYQRVLSMIDNTLDSSTSIRREHLSALKAQISAIPEGDSQNKTQEGMQSSKEQSLTALGRIEQRWETQENPDFRNDLLKLKANYEKKINRLK